ncbi:MAG: hypothetical protein H0T47_19575 [Planctomycetaceae bacterium]|nr:hypothetical protein [Planctomycetaceae bacterium]
MNTVTKLVFMTTPVVAAVSAAVIVAAAVLGFWSWHRSGYVRAHGIQELIRVGIVAVVALLFNQPEWVEEYRPDEKPTIAVYWDQSRSMETRDVQFSTGNQGSIATSTTRAAAIEPLTKREAWTRVGDRLQVVVEPIPAPQSGEGTDLHAILAAAPERVSNLLGVVLVSDGDWNAGSPPGEAASRLRMRNVPVFTVLAGSSEPLPDVELTSVDLPTFGVSGKVVRVPFTIESTLPRDHVTTVTLKTSDGETLTKDVRIAAMGRTSDAFSWKPSAAGDLTATVEVPRHADELVPDNNTKSAPIAIRPERLRVLLVESYPRWEYRYLRNALTRDPGVELSCLLFHPELSKPGGGAKNYIKEFPPGIEELSAYDVVFLGDVGVESGQLTAEQCRMVKGLVEHQASGLVFMPGWQGRQFSLLETELAALYPVQLDTAQPGGWGSRTASQFELTERGRDSLLTRLADTADENVAVWEELPGFQWYAPVVRAKAGTEVLAVHADASNEYGRLPLLATRTFGVGKVLFMGTDGAWRWRKGVEDLYHYRFWGQVVRWMAYQRNMAKGETMRLFYTPDQPKLRRTMSLHAHVMERGGEPLSKGDVVARITAPSGKVETVRLVPEGEEWGVFHGRHVPSEPGRHQVTLACKQTSATLDAQFFVPGETAEPIGKPARPEVLQEIARMTKGRAVTVSETNIDGIIRSLAELPLPPPSIRRLQLWSHPLAAGAVIVLLGGFWVLRKAIGLI